MNVSSRFRCKVLWANKVARRMMRGTASVLSSPHCAAFAHLRHTLREPGMPPTPMPSISFRCRYRSSSRATRCELAKGENEIRVAGKMKEAA